MENASLKQEIDGPKHSNIKQQDYIFPNFQRSNSQNDNQQTRPQTLKIKVSPNELFSNQNENMKLNESDTHINSLSQSQINNDSQIQEMKQSHSSLLEQRDKAKQSQQKTIRGILPTNRRLSNFQKFDNWLWMGCQVDFQKQQRIVCDYLTGGKEFYLVIIRAVFLLIITFQLSLSCYDNIGGAFLDIKYITQWGLWFTWYSLIFGLYSTSYISDSKAHTKAYRYSPFMAWKWQIICFEIAFTLEIFTTILFWTLLIQQNIQMWNPMSSWIKKTNLIMDHTIPIIALLLDYFLANPVFIKRHIYAVLIIIIIYLPVYMYFIFTGNPPYPQIDLNSAKNFFYTLLFGLSILCLFLLLEMCTKLKLQKCGQKNDRILQIISRQDIDADGYKFSQFSKSDTSMSLTKSDGINFLNKDLVDKNQRRTVGGDQNSQNTIKLDSDQFDMSGKTNRKSMGGLISNTTLKSQNLLYVPRNDSNSENFRFDSIQSKQL